MPRITNPFRRHSDSWFVHKIVGLGPDSPSSNGSPQTFKQQPDTVTRPQSQEDQQYLKLRKHARFWELLRLLLWKNYKLLVRNKLSTAAELLLPLLFTLLIVAIRFFGAETKRFDNATVFEPFHPSLLPGIVQSCCNQIFYAPNSPAIIRLMDQVQRKHFHEANRLKYSFTGFVTENELLRAYANSSSGMYAETEDGTLSSTVLAGIVFTSALENNGTQFPSSIEYSLRFPAALRSQSGLLGERFSFGMKQAWFTEILYPIIQPFGPRAKDQATAGEPGYFTEGFLYLQHALEMELLNQLAPNGTVLPNSTHLRRFPFPAYVDDEFLVVLQPFLPLTLILSFIYTVTSISKTLTEEKENRIHESMKMMGLTNSLHWTAWFITFLTKFILSALIITVLLKIHLTEASKSAGLAVLPKSDPTLIFFCLLVHGFQLVSFCFLVASIFKTSNAASITSAVVWFLLFLPFPFLQPRYTVLSSKVKILWSLLTNMGVCFSCQVFCMFEGSQEGAQWKNIFHGVTPDDTFSIGNCILVMLFNGVVYFVAAVYISIVFPGEFGVGREWYFFLTKRYWRGATIVSKIPIPENPKDGNEFYERTPKFLVAGIQAINLNKEFEEVVAINRLNLTMYKNETFCLLGKNGAGKSTLFNILTGLYQPTTGTAFVNRRDIRTDLDDIRRSLGVCPQHNVLFEELTVSEHLEFFTTLKGLKGKAMREEVSRLLTAIGLTYKRNAQVKVLSGGMKRRLCVGIAFCGGSEVVILDEPTSGLDVEARRAIWDLIESEKVGRTVLLTTHFMEEAELLADRIAIIVSGNVKCCGSPLFLNKKYNGGYNLTIVMEEEGCLSGRKEITNFIVSFLPEAMLIRWAGKELTYTLPESKSTQFHLLFDAIERRRMDLGIETYGARLTSMEDIFIRVNTEVQGALDESTESNKSLTFISGSYPHTGVRIVNDFPSSKRNKSAQLSFQQFYASVVKKVMYVWRRRGIFIGQVLIPMGYLSVVLIVLRTIPGIFDPPPHRFELDHYELFGKTMTPAKCSVNQNSTTCSGFRKFFLSSIHKVIESIPADVSFLEALLHKESQDITAFNSKYIIGFDDHTSGNESLSTLTAFFNNQPLHTPPLALNTLTNALLTQFQINHTIHVTNHPFPYTNLDTQDTGTYWTVGFHVGYNTAFALTFVVAVFAVLVVKENLGAGQLQRVSGLHPAIYWISNFVVDYVNFLFPCGGLMFIFAIFSESIGFLSWSLQGYLLVLFLAFGWALIPLVYVVSRCFSVPAVAFAGCGVASAFSGFITILTITVLELPQINQFNLALVLHRIFLIFPTYALGRGITQMSINKKLQEKCAGFNLEFLCEAAPDSFCCVKLRTNYMDWEEVGIGKNVVYMLCVGALSFIVLALMECNLHTHVTRLSGKRIHNKKSSLIEEDDDVKLERERVAKTGIERLETLVIRDLSKSYGALQAVDKLTLGIKEGLCFGLLGSNGTGKTSTFKMLVGELQADSGDAFIASFSVTEQRRKTHKLIGYCPQFDALLDELTGRETLTMFARLRGVKEKEIGEIVNIIARELVFEQYLDRIVKNYSGGNKRKLSTAVALIGTPKVVFLDEPTAGMDPVARRHVWSAIGTRIRDRQTCVVLTSHSLEECEVLCSRIAIMKNGRIQCLGSPQQLKHKFGDGFSLVVQIKGSSGGKERLQRKISNTSQLSSMSTVSSTVVTSHSMQVIDNYLRSNFPHSTECILTSSHANYLHYHLKQLPTTSMPGDEEANVSWSSLFRTMENVKEQAGITAYSISQISLEQVFLSV